MTYTYDFLVLIGRLQPAHEEHARIVRTALTMSNRVIVLLGSANQPRSYRNPWTWQERAEMLLGAFSEEDRARIFVTPLLDIPYNDKSWIAKVQMSVQGIVAIYHPTSNPKIGLIGHSKDATSYYLKLFPHWGSVNVPMTSNISSTEVRDYIFSRPDKTFDSDAWPMSQLPISTLQFLHKFQETEDFKNMVAEYTYIKNYKAAWAKAPYPPIFVTVDAVVIQSGHVLLIKRKSHPGKGLWAIPGGFLNADEKIEKAVIRELREETKLKVPEPVLWGSIKGMTVFDDPNRSPRGRVITHAYYFLLNPQTELPQVKAASDAKEVKWFPLAEVTPEIMFEDHFSIIDTMTQGALS